MRRSASSLQRLPPLESAVSVETIVAGFARLHGVCAVAYLYSLAAIRNQQQSHPRIRHGPDIAFRSGRSRRSDRKPVHMADPGGDRCPRRIAGWSLQSVSAQ
jgi:hypothetical protein